MEGTEQAVQQGGFFVDGIPAWLIFMLIGVFVALVLIGTIKRKGVPFVAIIIVAVLVIIFYTNTGKINIRDWYNRIFGDNDIETEETTDETGEETGETSGLPGITININQD